MQKRNEIDKARQASGKESRPASRTRGFRRFDADKAHPTDLMRSQDLRAPRGPVIYPDARCRPVPESVLDMPFTSPKIGKPHHGISYIR